VNLITHYIASTRMAARRVRQRKVTHRSPLIVGVLRSMAIIAGLVFAAPAFAQAPVASDDNIGTGLAAIAEGGSITGSYNVLTNDTSATAMTAELVGGSPANATAFQLFSDGTFNFTHDGFETSSASFTYRANNGELSDIATVTITINNTNDTPVLSLNGPGTVNLGTGDTYNEQGASAADEEDDNTTLTGNIVIGGDTVDTSVPGSYVVTYNVTDSGSAPAVQITRTVNVTDDDAPVITLSGATSIDLTVGDSYSEPGFSAADNVDGDITGNVVVAGDTVNTNAVGTYVVTYNVSDAAGNPATQRTRTINVAAAPDTTPPVITLSGATSINLNVGDSYSEPGFSATDNVDGNITGNVVVAGDTVNTNAAGTYVVTYNVSDAAGNPATQRTRTINVNDGNPPVITRNGPATVNLNVGDTYNEQGATATDLEEGPVAVIIGGDTVNTGVAGTYIVTYNASDSAGNNATQVIRTVNVAADSNSPVITLNGPATVNLNVGDPYNEQGATATDPEEGPVAVVIGGDAVNTSVAGAYIVTYDASDSAGNNAAQVIRTVNVNAAPVASNLSIGGTVQIGQTLTGTYTYTDVDNDPEGNSTFRWLRNGAGIPGATSISYVLVAADTGQEIRFEVTPVAQSGLLTGIAVQSAPVSADNTAPIITGQVDLTTPEDTALIIALPNLTVTDPDNNFPADFTLTVLPGTNYSVVGATITPALNFSGPLTVPVTVNDGIDSSLVFNLTVTVVEQNDAPLITGQSPLSTAEDTSLVIVVTNLVIVDPGNSLPTDFTLTVLPALPGSNYTVGGNTVTPLEDFSGPLTVPVTVNDGIDDSPVFLLQVDVSAENDAPTLVGPIDDQTTVEGAAFNLNVAANFLDPDGPTNTFSATGLPVSGNIQFDPVTGVFSGTPMESDAQDFPYDVLVTLSDGEFSVSDTFSLTIAALDRANVSLAISAAPSPAILADEVQFTFSVRNNGPAPATGIELNGSVVGDGLTVTPSGATTCTIQAPANQVTSFTCAIGNLALGASTSLAITASTANPGAVTLSATAAVVAPVPIDPNVMDNSVQLAVGVAESFSAGAVQILGSSQVLSVAVGDVNMDGFPDLVLGTPSGQPLRIHTSDGFRDFSESPISVPDNSAHQGVALADFNNDGSLDLILANAGVPDTVYSNDGNGNFSLLTTLPGDTLSNDVGVGDFNNDGNMDIVFAVTGGNLVYRGNGSGGFTLSGGPLGTADSRAVAVGRVNNNNRPDIVFANVGSASRLWTGNNSAVFSSGQLFTVGDASSVVIAELLGSVNPNSLDVAFGRTPTTLGDIPGNPVLANNGSGTLAVSTTLGAAPTNDILAGDVNRDGLMDLVFVNATGVHQIWNRSGNTFALHSQQIFADTAVSGVMAELGMTDVGDPGGVDLAMGGTPVPGAGVYLNDSFGNLGRGDAVPPVLTLNGTDPMSVPFGAAFVDPRATATDNIDGDISASVIATGVVNTALVGSYAVTYDVIDFAGNSATPITRTVNVTPDTGTGGSGATAPITLLFMLISLIAMQRYRGIPGAFRIPHGGCKNEDD